MFITLLPYFKFSMESKIMNGPALKKFLDSNGDYVWGQNPENDKKMWSVIGKHWTAMYEEYEKYKERCKYYAKPYWVSWEAYLMSQGNIDEAKKMDAKIIRKLDKSTLE